MATPSWVKLPPLGIGYLQAYLMQNGMEADLLDLNLYFYNIAEDRLRHEWLKSFYSHLDNMLSYLQSAHEKELETALARILDYEVIGFSCFKSNAETIESLIKILKSRKPQLKKPITS